MSQPIDALLALMARLRAPNGCPWDRQQTHESLKPHLLEETYEVLEAIDQKSPESLKEELGDLLLQVVFHAQIASERGEFTFDDVVRELSDKLVRRHPHVFHPPDTRPMVNDAEEVLHRWETLKQQEQQSASPASALEGVPKAAPALQRAYQIQKRAARAGFDWSQAEPVFDKLREECEELVQAIVHAREESHSSQEASSSAHSAIESEFGDVLFSLVNIARFLKINPEEALRVTTDRFIRRFQYLEEQARRRGRPLNEYTEAELDQWWNEAKAQERVESG